MPAKDVKILEEIQGYESRYFTFDKPIPFCGLNLYPVTMRDYDMLCIKEIIDLNNSPQQDSSEYDSNSWSESYDL